MATAIQVQPGTTFPVIVVDSWGASNAIVAGNLTVTALKDVTINNANDIFTYTVLSSAGKQQVPTTATNSVSTNLVVDETLFFGTGTTALASNAAVNGLMGLSTTKAKCRISVAMGTKTFTANAYVTGLAPTVSADSPVWVTPCTFTVTGDYTIS